MKHTSSYGYINAGTRSVEYKPNITILYLVSKNNPTELF